MGFMDRESIMTFSFWDLEGPEESSIFSLMGEKHPSPDASPYNEEFQKQIENLTKQLDQKNKIYDKCLLENAKSAELLKLTNQHLKKADEKYDILNKVKVNQERIS